MIKRWRRRCAHVLVWLVLLVPAVAAGAEAPASVAPEPRSPTPRALIERLNTTLLELMQRARELGYEGRARTVEPVVRASYDLPNMARIALGRHWKQLDAANRERFIELFARLTVANYAGRFDGYAGESFEVLSEDEAPRGLRVVRSRIHRPRGSDVDLAYRVRPVGSGGWRIIDVFLNDTVSELAMRRAEYTSVIRREGYPALVDALEAKIQQLQRGNGSAAE